MTYTQQLAHWVAATRARMEEFGRVFYKPPTMDLLKPACHVGVEIDRRGVELIVWDSGEAEYVHGPFDATTQEHHDFSNAADLDALLEDFMRRATAL